MSKIHSNSIMYKVHCGGRGEGRECMGLMIGRGVADSKRRKGCVAF